MWQTDVKIYLLTNDFTGQVNFCFVSLWDNYSYTPLYRQTLYTINVGGVNDLAV